MVGALTKKVLDGMVPELKATVLKASEAAEPTIRKVVREDVVPAVGAYVIAGMAAVAVVSSLIGGAMARRVKTRPAPKRGRRAA